MNQKFNTFEEEQNNFETSLRDELANLTRLLEGKSREIKEDDEENDDSNPAASSRARSSRQILSGIRE